MPNHTQKKRAKKRKSAAQVAAALANRPGVKRSNDFSSKQRSRKLATAISRGPKELKARAGDNPVEDAMAKFRAKKAKAATLAGRAKKKAAAGAARRRTSGKVRQSQSRAANGRSATRRKRASDRQL